MPPSLVRPKQGRVIAGVCLALANYFKIDVAIVRIIFVILTFAGGLPGILLYLLVWVATPEA